MIKECNFKTDWDGCKLLGQWRGDEATGCSGEDECILFQIYKQKNYPNDELKKVIKEQDKRLKKWADEVVERTRKWY